MSAKIINSLVRSDLSSFIKKSFATVNPATQYQHNWHIDKIADYLIACENGEIKRLIINIPPRSLKSISVTVAWTAWLLGHEPSRRIIAASYSQKLSEKHSMDSKLILASQWYKSAFPQVAIAAGQNDKAKFVTVDRGYRLATSVGGTVTGEGGNFLIIDDPHKPDEVLSDLRREEVLRWFDQTFSSRLDDKKKGVFVLVMQRLHEDDLTGYLLKKGGWEHLCLPAIDDSGRLLHANREGHKQIEQIKRDLGSYAFSAQYLQKPVPTSGGMIKICWFNRFDSGGVNQPYQRIIQSWDTAVKAGVNNDYSVCTSWGLLDNNYYLLDVLQEKMEYPELKKVTQSHAEKWQVDVILLEDKASGQSLIQDLRKETNLVIIPIMPRKDKVTRVAAISAMIEAGMVYLPKEAHWLADFEAQVAKFPKTTHDDMVDSMSQFLNWLRCGVMSEINLRGL